MVNGMPLLKVGFLKELVKRVCEMERPRERVFLEDDILTVGYCRVGKKCLEEKKKRKLFFLLAVAVVCLI